MPAEVEALGLRNSRFAINAGIQDTCGTSAAGKEACSTKSCRTDMSRKCLKLRNLAEREGFEPSVPVLASTTV